MPSDKQNAEFCYAMLKQLDLKYIDWKLVASANDISNGHAARMRFSRFRQQMEGSTPTPRGPRGRNPKGGGEKAASGARKRKGCAVGADGDAGSVKRQGDDGSERPAKRVKREDEKEETEDDDEEEDVPLRLRRCEVKAEERKAAVKAEEREAVIKMEVPTVKMEMFA